MVPNPLGRGEEEKPSYTREQVSCHKRSDDCWIIIDGEVYNVSSWLRRHPGGPEVLRHYGGEDASLAFQSFHNNQKLVRSRLAQFHIGHVVEEEKEHPDISKDFLKLRQDLVDQGLFRVRPTYFVFLFLHILALEIGALLILWTFGNTWSTWLVGVVLVATAQAQAGWLQHDFGHHSVFNNTTLNHLVHDVTIGWMKGVSSYWWNLRHFQHHAKPNVFLKDPDITISFALLLGKTIPAKWGKRHWGKMPYHLQHLYFFLTMPPLLLPIYFHLEVVYYCITRRKWKDIAWMLSFYVCWHLLFSPVLGGFWASFRFYFAVRVLESHWFTWATQISHLPMDVDLDKRKDWVSMQMAGTRNATSSWFWDWFLGHLNFQIEHHLFPTMPRHNFRAAQSQVRALCDKHGVEYQLVPIWTAFADIIRSLRHSGQVWLEAWKSAPKVH